MDKRNRNALHYAVLSGCEEACEVILANAQARGCSADLVNMRELYLEADQCSLVRGKKGLIFAMFIVYTAHLLDSDWLKLLWLKLLKLNSDKM